MKECSCQYFYHFVKVHNYIGFFSFKFHKENLYKSTKKIKYKIHDTQNSSEDNYYTSTKSWRGYIFTSVCLCVCVCVCVCLSVCVSVCPALLVNKIPAERMHRFGRGFR